MKRLFLDLDGVLINWLKGAHQVHDKEYHEEWPYVRGPLGWHFYKDPKFNVSGAHLFDGMDRSFWANLEWTKDGKDILTLCEEHFGDDVYLLTAPHQQDGVVDGRMDWIRREMPEYVEKVLVGKCKKACAHGDTVLVDDWDENLYAWDNAGGIAVTCPRPWNCMHRQADSVVYLDEQLMSLRN